MGDARQRRARRGDAEATRRTGRTSGRHEAGTPNRSVSSSAQARDRMSNSIVRLALEASVAWTPVAGPPVSFHSTHESTVPNARSGPAATPPSVSSHSSLVAEKYGSSTSPVVRRTRGEVALGRQCVAARRRAPVLPDQRPVEGPAGAAVPHDRGLALVGDADRRHRLAVEAGGELGQRLLGGRPDVVGVVLDQPGGREVLRELAVGVAGRGAVGAHGEAAHPGRPGVDGDHHGHRRHASCASQRRGTWPCDQHHAVAAWEAPDCSVTSRA